jgi:TonB family protein
MQPSFSPSFGMLPEPEGRTASFLTSSAINLAILATVLIVGSMARHVLQQHYEMTELIAPTQPPPPPMKIKPVMPKLPPPPQIPKLQMEAPKIQVPQPKPPEPKPIQMQAKVALPTIKAAKPQFILAPQPKAALTAAMPAQTPQAHPSTAPVHFGQTFGVTPNPNANRPATVAAIGNPYGGSQGPAVAPHGVVGSAGIGNGTRSGSNAGYVGHVASAGIPGATGTANTGGYGKVASAGIPTATVAPVIRQQQEQVASTSLEVISKPPVRYTSEARALHVEGDVVLRVTFLASGQVVVQGIVRGLGHGLDEEARRVAEQIRFRPATRNGRAIDLTTNITITFQLA